MTERAIRFGIRDGDFRASTWKVWTSKGEVYLACRELRGELHASMHASGSWHIGHSREYFESEAKGVIPWVTSRFTDRWVRPDAISPGATFAFQIVTPWWSVTTPATPKDFKNVKALPNAAPGRVTLVSIFLVAPGTPPPEWSQTVGSLRVRDDEDVLVAYWTTDATNLSQPPEGRGAFYRGKGPEDVLRAGNLRMLGFGTAANGARAIFDYAVAARAI